MRGVPGWQLTRCIVPTLLRGAESIRMIYRARAGTFFCIFFVFLARGSVGLKSMLWVCGTILPKKMKKEDMQICFFFILSLLFATLSVLGVVAIYFHVIQQTTTFARFFRSCVSFVLLFLLLLLLQFENDCRTAAAWRKRTTTTTTTTTTPR